MSHFQQNMSLVSHDLTGLVFDVAVAFWKKRVFASTEQWLERHQLLCRGM